MARPEPMNAMPTHSKAKVSLYFSDPLFVAGENVTGKMVLECKAEKGLGISDIKVELFAIQELTSRDHSATNTFLHLTRFFQEQGLPPSNAVHAHPQPNDEILPVDYYHARKGITTFFFRFPLPSSSPATIDFGKGLAKLKYEVRASAGVSWRNDRQRIMERKEVRVVEAPESNEESEQVVVGENGKIWVQGRLLNSYVVSGQDACVELFVKNHSAKRTTSLNLNITRHLHLPALPQPHKSLQLSDTLLTMPFKGQDYVVQPNMEGIANLVFSVPQNAQGVRPGRLDPGDEHEHDVYSEHELESLFYVQCVLGIKLGMGFGNKDIVLEMPVRIVHPDAMASLPPSLPPELVHSPPVSLPYPMYQSPPPTDMFSPAYITPSTSPPLGHIHLNHPLWSLQPHRELFSPHPAAQPHIAYDQLYYYPSPPISYGLPARPSSADPFVAQQLPVLPPPPMLSPAKSDHDAELTQSSPRRQDTSIAIGVEVGEPGKGERASRISAHLRLSSRNRSTSPQSHRFPQTTLLSSVEHIETVEPGTPKTDQFPSPAGTVLHGTRPFNPANTISPTSPISQTFLSASPKAGGGVLSPRPMLSPKHSFSIDRGTVKCEQVVDLERMAAEELASNELNGIRSDDELKEDRNKSLPLRPTLSIINGLTSAPSGSEPPYTPKLPPEPTLHPVPTRAGSDMWNRNSGLAALERKLLEQVGTRKAEPERRLDVRSILAGPGPILEHRRGPSPIRIPSTRDVRPDPLNDSAISSLALAADTSSGNLHSPVPKEKGAEEALPSSTSILDGLEMEVKKGNRSGGKEREKYQDARRLRKAVSGRVAAWLGGLESASPPPACETLEIPESIAPEAAIELSNPLDPHPLLRTTPSRLQNQDAPALSPVDAIPTRSSGFVLHTAKDTSTPFVSPQRHSSIKIRSPQQPQLPAKFDSATLAPPNSSKAIAKPLEDDVPSPLKPVLQRFALAVPKGGSTDAKYDIRSARGGRGGKVTSVAALWTSLASQQEGDRTSDSRSIGKAGSFSPDLKQAQMRPPPQQNRNKPSPKTSPHTRHQREPAHLPPDVTNLTNRRAKMVKSTSVPAVVSSSLATPVISSTASLARPIQSAGPYPKRSYPLQASQPLLTQHNNVERPITTSTSAPAAIDPMGTKFPPKGDLAFGQAKLRDLIKKYQQGF